MIHASLILHQYCANQRRTAAGIYLVLGANYLVTPDEHRAKHQDPYKSSTSVSTLCNCFTLFSAINTNH
jgi:hypothetical protein